MGKRFNAKHIYDYIAMIEARPSMYVMEYSLKEVELLLYGYVACLEINGIVEDYEGRPFHPRDFAGWLWESHQWSGSCGFAYAINNRNNNAEEAFSLFMKLVSEFRQSS